MNYDDYIRHRDTLVAQIQEKIQGKQPVLEITN